MKRYLDNLPLPLQELISRASVLAGKEGSKAYLVGGIVRDLLLGISNLDLDLVVEGDGISFAEKYARLLNAKLIRHHRFGTATVIIKPSLKVDIATSRKEAYPIPACLPAVKSSTLEDDLCRRDFTINAMAISINKDDFARLIDIFDGQKDLKEGKIRVLHEASFLDDPTRILRAIRFEKRYDFRIEKWTLDLLKKACSLNMLEKVQPHRLRDEFILNLKEPSVYKQLKRIKQLAGLNFICPGLDISVRTERLFTAIKRQILWFKKCCSHRRQLDSWLIYLMGLLDTLSVSDIEGICERFAFRKGETKRLLDYRAIKPKFISGLSSGHIKPWDIFRMLEPLSYETVIMLKSRHKNGRLQRHINDFFRLYNGMRLHISGSDLQELGVSPGPEYQRIFSRLLAAKLNGVVKNKEEELALARKLI